jgi:starch synthase
MRLLFVTSEAYPLAKTGGLADVSRSLPAALRRKGVDVRVLMPGYPCAILGLKNPEVVSRLPPAMGIDDGILIAGHFPDCDLPVWMVSSGSLFNRAGGLYQDDAGQDWPDNARRFAYLSQVGAEIALGRTTHSWQPDVVHGNDWHTGLLPLLIANEPAERPRTVFTTHNMAFQGNFPPGEVPALPDGAADAIEFYGRLSYLKAGLRFADRVTTVSPTYAREILTPEYGFGLEGVLQERGPDFRGILNGIDDEIWNPATDPFLAANYRVRDTTGKRLCKRALQEQFGLAVEADTPLLGFVSRLTGQKMADSLVDAIGWIAAQGAQLVVVGEGNRMLETALANAAAAHNGQVAVSIGYDEALAHKLQAGSDILLSPARFEPCGLTQLYALRYGTLPVVRRTGGLADTVTDTNNRSISDHSATGFVFEDTTVESMIAALSRALTLYREPLQWRLLQLQAMTREFSWDTSAAAYIALYEDVCGVASVTIDAVDGGETTDAARRAAG